MKKRVQRKYLFWRPHIILNILYSLQKALFPYLMIAVLERFFMFVISFQRVKIPNHDTFTSCFPYYALIRVSLKPVLARKHVRA